MTAARRVENLFTRAKVEELERGPAHRSRLNPTSQVISEAPELDGDSAPGWVLHHLGRVSRHHC